MISRELVPGKLRIVRRIGAGGMGVVYEAVHLRLDRRVAVKVIHPQSSESTEARARLFREARALALLQSEYIVQVLDVDTLADGDPYMVMEYLEGRDLRRELVKRGPLPVAEAVGYLIQAATGVAAAHGAGITHRDIKPANIFITNLDGARRAKLLDFGVAKFSASADQQLTGPTCLLGTPLYMSPEQIAGMEANSCCDVWALGVVLFQLLTGHSPFRHNGKEGGVAAALNGAAALLHEVREDVPPALSWVVARCLEKSPVDRFQDAGELALALSPFGAREPLVRPSRRAPRGSSAPPPELAREQELAQEPIPTRTPELVASRELVTVIHPKRAASTRTVPLVRETLLPEQGSLASVLDPAGPVTDAHATVRLQAPAPAPPKAVLPTLSSSSGGLGSTASVFGRRFFIAIGGALTLGLAIAVCAPRLSAKADAPAVDRLRPDSDSGSSAVPSSDLAPKRELTEPTPNDPSPSVTAHAPSSPSVRHSRHAFPENPLRAAPSGTTTKSRTPIQAAPATSAGTAAVPLHL